MKLSERLIYLRHSISQLSSDLSAILIMQVFLITLTVINTIILLKGKL